jgi:hypothetical protein
MDSRTLVGIFGILLVMIPVAGLTFGLTLRFAVKPFVETLARALREGKGADGERLAEQVLLLREEVETLSHEVRDLRGVHEFDQKLMASPRVPAEQS